MSDGPLILCTIAYAIEMLLLQFTVLYKDKCEPTMLCCLHKLNFLWDWSSCLFLFNIADLLPITCDRTWDLGAFSVIAPEIFIGKTASVQKNLPECEWVQRCVERARAPVSYVSELWHPGFHVSAPYYYSHINLLKPSSAGEIKSISSRVEGLQTIIVIEETHTFWQLP